MKVQVACPERHEPRWVDLPSNEFGLTIAGNGAYQIRPWCSECGRWATSSLPVQQLRSMGLTPEDCRLVADNRGNLGRCSRFGCEKEGVEDHHFAPRALFGMEADEWPRALLCVDHHNEWHRRMRVA